MSPVPMEGPWGKMKRAGFSGLLVSHQPVTSWLTLDKSLNLCSCFLIIRQESVFISEHC